MSSGVSVALLFDVSGSMEGLFGHAREAATHVLSWLDVTQDEAGVFRFDTRLEESMPFTSGLRTLPPALSQVMPFGATSLFDAIARTAERVDAREGRRRAVIVFTDGNDNASRMTPAEVSGIASAIDVPVYIFGVVSSIDNPSSELATGPEKSPLAGPAGRSRELDRRARVRVQHAGGAQPGGAADRGRTAASVSRSRSSRAAIRAGTSSPCGFAATRRWSFEHEVVTSRGTLARIRCRRSSVMRTLFKVIPVALIVVTGTTACASKKFVRTSVGEVNDKVDSLGRSVEETQERTRRNEGRINEVDQKAQAAAADATRSRPTAHAADAKNTAVDAQKRGEHGRHQARDVRQAEPRGSCTRSCSARTRATSSSARRSCRTR